MDAEIRSLEEKINQFVALCQRLRADNHQLRQQLASAQSENKHLPGILMSRSMNCPSALTVPEHKNPIKLAMNNKGLRKKAP